MGLPSEPITLTVAEIEELNKKLASLRHDVNNNLSLIIAAAELIKQKPSSAERMISTLIQQPPRISDNIKKFCDDFEKAFRIKRP